MPRRRMRKRIVVLYRKTLWQRERFLIFRGAVMDGKVDADPWRLSGLAAWKITRSHIGLRWLAGAAR